MVLLMALWVGAHIAIAGAWIERVQQDAQNGGRKRPRRDDLEVVDADPQSGTACAMCMRWCVNLRVVAAPNSPSYCPNSPSYSPNSPTYHCPSPSYNSIDSSSLGLSVCRINARVLSALKKNVEALYDFCMYIYTTSTLHIITSRFLNDVIISEHFEQVRSAWKVDNMAQQDDLYKKLCSLVACIESLQYNYRYKIKADDAAMLDCMLQPIESIMNKHLAW